MKWNEKYTSDILLFSLYSWGVSLTLQENTLRQTFNCYEFNNLKVLQHDLPELICFQDPRDILQMSLTIPSRLACLLRKPSQIQQNNNDIH